MIYSPRGVEDILPERSGHYRWVEAVARELFELHGFGEIRTPLFERIELFARSLGEETDVGKQMYVFNDRAGRSLALRPEGTASIVRSYLEHNVQAQEKEWRVHYAGPMFRYERPQAHRLRQFRQIGVEILGQASVWADVETAYLAYILLQHLGLSECRLHLNYLGCNVCRPRYEAHLREYLADRIDTMCPVCRRRYRTNLLRILDCKRLQCRKVCREVPPIADDLCDNCRGEFEQLQESLGDLDVPFFLDHSLVRGLDYYTRTIFEVTSGALGAQDAISGGGRYDNLVEELGGPPTPAIGFSLGVERLLGALDAAGALSASVGSPLLFVATLGPAARKAGMNAAAQLWDCGVKTIVNLYDKGLSWQLKSAHRRGASWALLVGDRELEKGQYVLRNMDSGDQTLIPRDQLQMIAEMVSLKRMDER